MLKYISFILCVICNFIFGEIVEITKINEIGDLDKYQLIIFDLDNTIVRPIQLLGSDEWFYHTLKKYEDEGLDPDSAYKKNFYSVV